MKPTVREIRVRFDAEVERFDNLSTGQYAAIGAPPVLVPNCYKLPPV
jgi:hypothetical protein